MLLMTVPTAAIILEDTAFESTFLSRRMYAILDSETSQNN